MSTLPQDAVAAVRGRYQESHRAYHNLIHLDELLSLYKENAQLFHCPDAVLAAIYWHDAIYEPSRRDNEARSAALLHNDLDGLVPADIVACAAILISATSTHQVPSDIDMAAAEDCALFLDMDMAILGSPPGRFADYERDIAAEYGPVFGSDRYRSGRLEFLRQMLGRDRLFMTPLFEDRCGNQARKNIEAAIENLSHAT
jgi:predicted metal-dependent HD superfamily phosphohydrolase